MSTIKKYSPANLSDTQLLQHLDEFVHKERKTTLEILRHIMEVERRKLYLGRGYGSLYDYCTLHLGYSESVAMRRIRTACCIRDIPEISQMLKKNELNLTSVSKLAGILNAENKNELLREARFKSSRQIEAIVARHKPSNEIRDKVRTVFVKTVINAPTEKIEAKPGEPASRNLQSAQSNPGDSRQENWGKSATGAGGKKPCTSTTAQAQTSVLKKKFKLEFAVGSAFMEMLDEVKAILSKKYPCGVPFEKLFEVMMVEYLEKHSPERKIQRREKRKAKEKAKKIAWQDKPSKQVKSNNTKTKMSAQNKCVKSAAHKHSRHIPKAVQDEVFARDQGKCTFAGPDGMRCNSTWNLEIDHVRPFARGGDHALHNLRLLCAKHNNLKAERIYGKKFMEWRKCKTTPMRR